MPSRRKINLAAVQASVADRNPDDPRPWFVVRYFPPPIDRSVRLAWPDGATNAGELTLTGWRVALWHSDKPPRNTAPVGWKPLGLGANMPIGQCREPMPDPLHYGIEIR